MGVPAAPRVKVIVLNFNGGDLVLESLRRLAETDWPRDRLNIVVVDNGSSDGSDERIAEVLPGVELLKLPHNVGYAGGNNAALRDLSSCDYVALLNNDAFVDERWLTPLVSTLERDPRIGAANSKVLLAPAFVELSMSADDAVVTGLEVCGKDVWERAWFIEGFDTEDGTGGRIRPFSGAASVWLPVSRERSTPVAARVCVAANRIADVEFRSGEVSTRFRIGREPTWIEIDVDGPAFDVINNVGNVLLQDGHGADRGLGERDVGQYERAEEIFAWCGCSALLSRAYLEDVGLFEEDLFVYYEDFDLAWRGRARGWRYMYVPDSITYHVHAATSREGTAFFEHYVERNRLTVILRNASLPFVVGVVYGYLRMVVALIAGDVVSPLLRRRRPELNRVWRRVRSFAAFSVRVPRSIRDRLRLRAEQTVSDAEIRRWALPR